VGKILIFGAILSFLYISQKDVSLNLGDIPLKIIGDGNCLYRFENQRWSGLGEDFTFDQVFEEIKTITEDIRADGKITWGFWNHEKINPPQGENPIKPRK
jgi:hypothetical protein